MKKRYFSVLFCTVDAHKVPLVQMSQTRVAPEGRVVRAAMLFGNFQLIEHLCHLVHSPVFKSARLASEQVPFNERKDG